jgi:hypothetical protein
VPAPQLGATCTAAPSRLYFRLIRVRSRASASYREAASVQVTDGADRTRIHYRSPENRKVGGSTPPLATPRHLGPEQHMCGELIIPPSPTCCSVMERPL